MSPATRLPRPRPPVGQSMALLTELMEHPLDGSYQDRAEARAAKGEPRLSGHRSPLLLIACLALGLLLVVAAQTLRVPKETASGERGQIIDQIEGKQRSNDTSKRTITRLRSQIGTLRSRGLDEAGSKALATRLRQTETAAGAVAVTGPGLVMTLDDRASAAKRDGSDPRDGGRAQDVLTSGDLQVLVNGLWQAGAEAVSINGNRLTSLSAIRFAGEAILVDFRPLARPYKITAIGKPTTMWQTFRDGSGGAYLDATKRLLGLDVHVDNTNSVSVPASASVALHKAKPSGGSTPTASGRGEETS